MFIFQFANTQRSERLDLTSECRRALDSILSDSQLNIGEALRGNERRNIVAQGIATQVREEFGSRISQMDQRNLNTIVMAVAFDILISRATNQNNRERLEENALVFYRSKVTNQEQIEQIAQRSFESLNDFENSPYTRRHSIAQTSTVVRSYHNEICKYTRERVFRTAAIDAAFGSVLSETRLVAHGVSEIFSYIAEQTPQLRARLLEAEIETMQRICQRRYAMPNDMVNQARAIVVRAPESRAFHQASQMLVGAMEQEILLNGEPSRLHTIPRPVVQMVFEAGGIEGFAHAIERTRNIALPRAMEIAQEIQTRLIRLFRDEGIEANRAQRTVTDILTTAATRIDRAHNFQGEQVDPNHVIVSLAVGGMLSDAIASNADRERRSGFMQRLGIEYQASYIYRFSHRGENYEIGSRIPIENPQTINRLLESVTRQGGQLIAVRSQSGFLDNENLYQFAQNLLLSISESNQERGLEPLRWSREVNTGSWIELLQRDRNIQTPVPPQRRVQNINPTRERYVEILRSVEIRNGVNRADETIYQRNNVYVYRLRFATEEVQIVSMNELNPTTLDQALRDIIENRIPIQGRTRSARIDGMIPRTYIAIVADGRLLIADEERAIAQGIRGLNQREELFANLEREVYEGIGYTPVYQNVQRREQPSRMQNLYAYSGIINGRNYEIASPTPIQTQEQLLRALENAENTPPQIYIRRRGGELLRGSEIRELVGDILQRMPNENRSTSIRINSDGISGLERIRN